MLDTLLASDRPAGRSPRSTFAALLLHLLLVAAALELTQPSSPAARFISRDTVRLDLGPLPPPAQPRTPGGRDWLAPPPAIPRFPDLPYMPTLDGTRMTRQQLHGAALVGLDPTNVPASPEITAFPFDDRALSLVEVDELPEIRGQLRPGYPETLRRAGITGEVKLEYVIDHTGKADSGSVRVIASTDPGFTMSCIEAVLGASFKPARRAGRPVAVLVRQTIRFEDR
jgi:periplasmic protein TonB